MENELTLDEIYKAASVLKGVARKTDLIYSEYLSNNNKIYLKTENLQTTGSFKLRGAYYKINTLTEEEKKAGIVACSAGNHAQGVALAATRNNIKATICMPDGAPISKVEATKKLGADVVLVKGAYDEAAKYAYDFHKKTNATLIHPFNDIKVIAGQGTIGLEIIEELEDLDAIVVPVGGGGLIAGVALAAKSLNKNIKIYGVQAKNADGMVKSFEQKKIISLDKVTTFADGIAVKKPGDLTYDIISKYVDDMISVSEDEIATAILTLIEKQKLISEGAGAVSVASVIFDKIPLKNKKIACLVSGGNIDVNILSRVITRGLVTSGRKTSLQIALEDKPGQLEDVSRIISEAGGNVISVHYEGSDPNMPIDSCFLTLGIETRDFNQIKEIENSLINNGFRIYK